MCDGETGSRGNSVERTSNSMSSTGTVTLYYGIFWVILIFGFFVTMQQPNGKNVQNIVYDELQLHSYNI